MRHPAAHFLPLLESSGLLGSLVCTCKSAIDATARRIYDGAGAITLYKFITRRLGPSVEACEATEEEKKRVEPQDEDVAVFSPFSFFLSLFFQLFFEREDQTTSSLAEDFCLEEGMM